MYIFSCIFTIVCAILLPLTLTVILCVRRKENERLILLGSLTYVVFRLLICTTLLQMLLPQITWVNSVSSAQPIFYALFKGLIAALFEVGGSCLVISLFLEKQRSTDDGIAFGVGQGGIEAIIITSINIFVLLLSSTRLTGPSAIFAGGVERVSILVVQIALSVMMMKSIRERKHIWLLLAFAIDTAVNFCTMAASVNNVNTWVTEVALLAAAAVMAWFVAKEFRKEASDSALLQKRIN